MYRELTICRALLYIHETHVNSVSIGAITIHIWMVINRGSERLSCLRRYQLYWFCRAATTWYRWLRQQKRIVLHFWRLEVRHPGVGRVGWLPPKAEGQICSRAVSLARRQLSSPGVSCHCLLYACLCVQTSPLKMIPVMLAEGPPSDLILT